MRKILDMDVRISLTPEQWAKVLEQVLLVVLILGRSDTLTNCTFLKGESKVGKMALQGTEYKEKCEEDNMVILLQLYRLLVLIVKKRPHYR